MNLTTNTEIKTIKGWEKFADEHSGESTDWGAYCKPGDIVGEDVYDYFLDILPPRTDGPDIEYTACECGMPSTREELLIPYMESAGDEPTGAIYPYTPVEVIEQVIAKHGGYFTAGLPVV